MIHALLQYAIDRELTARPGFGKKHIRWALDFADGGRRFVGIVASQRVFSQAPDLGQPELVAMKGHYGQASHFLVAPLSTFSGQKRLQKIWTDDDVELDRFATETRLLRDAGYGALADCLEEKDFRTELCRQIEALNPNPKETDIVTLRIDGAFPVESLEWHDWWMETRAQLRKAQGGARSPSFASGDLVEPESTHPKLTKLSGVGLSQPHAPIVTFDKEAFTSYGLAQGQNAAMEAGAAKAYVTALDDLLERSVVFRWQKATRGGQPELLRLPLKLGGARIIYWYTGPELERKAVEENLDIFAILGGSADQTNPPPTHSDEALLAEDRLHKAIEEFKTGKSAVNVTGIRFCTALLSGAGGRVMLRDFTEGAILDLAESSDRWFADLALETWTGTRSTASSLEAVLTSPLSPKKPDQDYLKWVPPVSAWRHQLWRAALTGSPIPQSAASRALLAHNKTVVRGELTDAETANSTRSRSRIRLSLVKAYLIRQGVRMTPALDPEHPSSAYHCGRLLAVYDDLQRAALGDVGAGVVQRFYGGALTNPAGVLGQLSRMSQAHLGKLGGGLAHIYETRLADIHNGIRTSEGEHATYPRALNMEDQALFALGYWHQIGSINKERAEASAAKKARNESNETGART